MRERTVAQATHAFSLPHCLRAQARGLALLEAKGDEVAPQSPSEMRRLQACSMPALGKPSSVAVSYEVAPWRRMALGERVRCWCVRARAYISLPMSTATRVSVRMFDVESVRCASLPLCGARPCLSRSVALHMHMHMHMHNSLRCLSQRD